MAIVSELVIYPIKSCAGLPVAEAQVWHDGLRAGGVHDREWMLVAPNGQFLSQREYPRMAMVVPRIDAAAGELVLDAPGQPPLRLPLAHAEASAMREVQIWDDTLMAEDCGDAAAAWFAGFLGGECRLVRFARDGHRPKISKWVGERPAATRFSDGYPLLLISEGSLDEVNAALIKGGRDALPMNRFRPNIVINDVQPFEEDYVAEFKTGQLALAPVKPCARCPIPAVDQATGIVGPDPLDLLGWRANARLDGAITVGMNVIVTAGAGSVLRVGDEFDTELAF